MAFLTGSIVRLQPPVLPRDVERGWADWFNDRKITQYLRHGTYPVTRETQIEHIRSEMARPDALLLTVEAVADGELLGIISLKDIDLINGNAEIVLVTGKTRMGAVLEAMALLTKHAFDRLNLVRVYAGTHVHQWKFFNQLALIGYRLEGYRREVGRRNGTTHDHVLFACLAREFYGLEGIRHGNILTDDIQALLATRDPINRVAEFRWHIERFHIGDRLSVEPECN